MNLKAAFTQIGKDLKSIWTEIKAIKEKQAENKAANPYAYRFVTLDAEGAFTIEEGINTYNFEAVTPTNNTFKKIKGGKTGMDILIRFNVGYKIEHNSSSLRLWNNKNIESGLDASITIRFRCIDGGKGIWLMYSSNYQAVINAKVDSMLITKPVVRGLLDKQLEVKENETYFELPAVGGMDFEGIKGGYHGQRITVRFNNQYVLVRNNNLLIDASKRYETNPETVADFRCISANGTSWIMTSIINARETTR